MAQARELLIVAKCQADLDRYLKLFQITDVQDVTDCIDIRQYPHLTRSGIGEVLGASMPATTHQRICVVLPKLEDETDDEWEMRAKRHCVLSILSSAYRDNFYIQQTGEF